MQKAQMEKLDRLFEKTVRNKHIQSATLRLESGDGQFCWKGVYGNTAPDGPPLSQESTYFTASATKIVTAVAILMLHEKGALNIEDPMQDYLPWMDLSGLHKRKGRDRTSQIRIYHLLGHTSGLPDYFEQGGTGSQSLLRSLLEEDRFWDLKFVLDRTRQMRPAFDPSPQEGSSRAHYSDTNYQLLGAIIKSVTDESMEIAINKLIFSALDLQSTYFYGRDHSDNQRAEPALFLYKNDWLRIPEAMASFRTDGSLVSNPREQIKILRALMNGQLVSPNMLTRMQNWNRIFFPFKYGYGLMRFSLPRILTGLRPMPAFIGHSGASGAINFHCPDRDLYVAGTVNQLASRSLSFQWMAQLPGIFA